MLNWLEMKFQLNASIRIPIWVLVDVFGAGAPPLYLFDRMKLIQSLKDPKPSLYLTFMFCHANWKVMFHKSPLLLTFFLIFSGHSIVILG